MRFKDLSWPVVVLIALTGTVPGAGAAEGADEAAIRAQTTSWGEAYNAANAEAITALYAEDALLLPPGAPAARGRDAILAFFKADVAASKTAGVVMHLDPGTEVGVMGDMGWESGTYSVTIDGAVVDTGKFMSVSVKRDGKWLYLRDTWNSDLPCPPADAPADTH